MIKLITLFILVMTVLFFTGHLNPTGNEAFKTAASKTFSFIKGVRVSTGN